MPGIAEIALGAAPIAGGALLGVAAGNLKGPDVRGQIKQDFDLLERIPPEETERRANVAGAASTGASTISSRPVTAAARCARRRCPIRATGATSSFSLNTVLFTFIWWHVSHSRTNWLTIFIFMIVLSIIAGVYALRGVIRALRHLLRERRRSRHDSAG